MERLEYLAQRGDMDALRALLRDHARRGAWGEARTIVSRLLETRQSVFWCNEAGSAAIDPLKILEWPPKSPLFVRVLGVRVPLRWDAARARRFAHECLSRALDRVASATTPGEKLRRAELETFYVRLVREDEGRGHEDARRAASEGLELVIDRAARRAELAWQRTQLIMGLLEVDVAL